MSLTEVLPTEPVTPTTLAPSARRYSRESECRAASGSSTTRIQGRRSSLGLFYRPKDERHRGETTTPQAPASIAAGANSPPSRLSPRRPKKRSPGPASAELIVARRGGSAGPSATTSAPNAAAISAGERFTPAFPAGGAPPAPPRGRRRESFALPRTPAPARDPC